MDPLYRMRITASRQNAPEVSNGRNTWATVIRTFSVEFLKIFPYKPY